MNANSMGYLFLIAAVCLAGFGGYSYYSGMQARDARLQTRLALEASDPVGDPEDTIVLARDYLTSLETVTNPDPASIRWALSRYELAVRRTLALGAGRLPEAELAPVTEGFVSVKAMAEARLAVLEAAP